MNITVGISGTGGGFERFCAGETDLSDASRPIKTDPADKEATVCEANGIDYTEFLVANDGISLVVNKDNTWAKCLTVAQLNKIWDPNSKVNNWNQVDPSFPDQPMKLFGPGTDSGTFDFFTGDINGEEGVEPHRLLRDRGRQHHGPGVEGEKGGLGYFGYSYYEENKDKLNVVQVDCGNGCVDAQRRDGAERRRTRRSPGRCSSTSKNTSFKRPEVEAFMKYIIDNEAKVTGPPA